MPTRRRPVQEFEATQSEVGPRTVTLDSLIGGYNGYTSPDLLSPQFWAAASNVYAGQFGAIRRARWAPVVNPTTSGYGPAKGLILYINGFAPPSASPFVMLEIIGFLPFVWTYGGAVVFPARNNGGPGTNPTIPSMFLPVNAAYILQANNNARQKYVIASTTFMYWGLDAPDASPQISLTAGSTATIAASPTGAVRANNVVTITATGALPAGFVTGVFVSISGVTDTTFNTAAGAAVQITVTGGTTFTFPQIGPAATSGSGTATLGITKTVGRSYQHAWENANVAHVSAPSPASQYVKYASQTGTIDCVEVGTVTGNGVQTYTGTGTAFSTAWVGRSLWVEGEGNTPSNRIILSVTSPTSLTTTAASNLAGKRFAVIDQQMTHLKLYATGDGGSVYFLYARNAFSFGGTTPLAAGLEFSDTANSEPPNAPFGSELTQIYNVPPPIGSFVQDYQGRALTYGVPAALQTFFYSNIEATVVGQPPESFAPLNTVTLPIGDGQINGMANLPTGLLIWSNRQDMFKLTGLLTDNTVANSLQLGATIQRLPYKIGAASPYATAVTPLGAIWLSSDREVWLFTDHYAPKNVGKSIQDVLNRINGTRLGFARMSYYKRGDRSWLALAVALSSSTFNNKLLLLDLDLLASNGQPSFFTFDMATNQPTWYQYDINCEGLCSAYDANSQNHLLTGDVDLVTDTDWQAGFYTVSAEQNVTGSNKLHAFGNEDPHMIKNVMWMRALTNQIPANLAAQGWAWSIDSFDDDAFVIGVNPNTTTLTPGTDSNANTLFLEYSPALFAFGGVKSVNGRRFQIGTTFPNTPGLFELRGFEVSYMNLAGR